MDILVKEIALIELLNYLDFDKVFAQYLVFKD